MAYRDVSESLRAYRDRIRGDLDEARRERDRAAQIGEKVRVLEAELAETDQLLARYAGGRRALPVLENVAVAAPCHARWEEMVGDEHVRFCAHCAKNVYNLSSLPRAEAEALLAARGGAMCIRLYRRTDGTVLTEDCPVGVTRRRRRRTVAGVVGGGLLAAGAALAASTSRGMVVQGDPLPMRVDAGMKGHAPAPAPTPSAGEVLGQWGGSGPSATSPAATTPDPISTHVVMGRRAQTR